MRNLGRALAGLVAVLFLTACSGTRALHLSSGAAPYALAFAPAGDALVVLYETEGGEHFAECRSLPEGRLRWRVEGAGLQSMSAAFSSDGSEVALYDGQRLRFYDAREGDLRHEIDLGASEEAEGPLVAVFHIRYLSPDRLALLTQREDTAFLEIWGRDGSPAQEPLDLGPPGGAWWWWQPFTRDGSRLAFIPAYIPVAYHAVGIVDVVDGESRLWDLSASLPDHTSLSTLAFSPDGKEVALGLSHTGDLHGLPLPDRMVLRLDAATGEVFAAYALPSDARPGETVTYLAYSPDGRFLAATTLGTEAFLLYDLSTSGAEPQVLCQGEGCCRHAPLFSPDGDVLATTCKGQVLLREVPR